MYLAKHALLCIYTISFTFHKVVTGTRALSNSAPQDCERQSVRHNVEMQPLAETEAIYIL